MKIPFVDLQAQYQSIKSELDDAILNVIRETAFIGGKYVEEFEKAFGELYGVKHVISCANGTDSLYIIMKMLGIGPGDEVVTVANSWISSAETISQTGARPVFVDIEPDYYSMDITQLESAITPRTKAVIAVHLQGQPCEIEKISKICKAKGVFLIEDCAQAHFSELNGIRTGSFGIAASFSFYPGKNLGAYGDAGCITTNVDDLATKCRMYARHGALIKHQHVIEGINSRMDGMQAAILLAKLPHILEWTEKRIEIARMYSEKLSSVVQVKIPQTRPFGKHTWHLYVIAVDQRDQLMQWLRGKGIETAIHYPVALPNLTCYNYLKYTPQDFPVATACQSSILSLPIYPELTELQIDYVVAGIKEFYKAR